MSLKSKDKRPINQPRRILILVIFAIVIIIGGYLGFRLFNDEVERQVSDAMSTQIIAITTHETSTPTHTATATLTSLDEVDVTPMCFFNWAYGDVPFEDVATLHTILKNAGYMTYSLEVSAYGEDQICQRGDEIVSSRFLMMDIIPSIILNVDTLDNPSELGAHIRNIITAFDNNETLPKISRVEIEFSDETDSRLWSAQYFEYSQALANGVTDEDLYEMGGNVD